MISSTSSDNKCNRCRESICCRYLTQQIDPPKSKRDFHTLLWQIAHQQVEIYQDEDGWFLLIKTPCSFLQEDGRCGIYHQRPLICQEYDNDWCELDEPAEKHFKRHFTSHQQLLDYCRGRFKKWDR